MFGNRTIFGCIDEYDSCVFIIPLKGSSDAPGGFEKILRYQRAPHEIRTDNGPEFQSLAWGEVLSKHKIKLNSFGPPHTPTKQSRIERMWRTLANKSRACMIGLDKRLTDLSYLYVSYSYMCRERKFKEENGTKVAMTPFERRYGIVPSKTKLKRFGCLTFVHNFNTNSKMDLVRWIPSAFCGYNPKGIAYLVANFNEAGESVLMETGHAKFHEQYLVANLILII